MANDPTLNTADFCAAIWGYVNAHPQPVDHTQDPCDEPEALPELHPVPVTPAKDTDHV